MYTLEILPSAAKQLQKLDKQSYKIISAWLHRHLEGIDNPRRFGKPLKGKLSAFWRYRIGDYRLLAKIDDDKIKIFVFELAHRKEVYRLAQKLVQSRQK